MHPPYENKISLNHAGITVTYNTVFTAGVQHFVLTTFNGYI